MILFGSGKLIATPLILSNGSPYVNPTPVIFGSVSDVGLDITFETKTLYGSGRYPIAIGQGKGKVEVKARYADISSAIVGSLFLGKTSAAGTRAAVFDFVADIPSASPYQITVSPPSSGTFVEDLGVFEAATGRQYTRVGTVTATRQYSVSTAGVYTFSSVDAGKTVKISYEYYSAGTGSHWLLENDTMGQAPYFSMILQNTFDTRTLVCKLYRVTSGKITFPFRMDDFTIFDFEAEACANPAGSIGYICFV